MSSQLSAIIDLDQTRKQFLTNQLQPQGIDNENLLNAFEKVPREIFLEAPLQPRTYFDADLLVSEHPKRSLLSPRKLARLFQAAALQPSEKVLVIGFGTGYSLAIGHELGLKVYGVEENPLFFSFAFTSFQTYIEQFYDTRDIENILLLEEKPLNQGLPEHAPYDAIIVEGCVEKVPDALLKQLRPHGRIACISEIEHKGICVYDALGHARYVYFESADTLPGFKKEVSFDL